LEQSQHDLQGLNSYSLALGITEKLTDPGSVQLQFLFQMDLAVDGAFPVDNEQIKAKSCSALIHGLGPVPGNCRHSTNVLCPLETPLQQSQLPQAGQCLGSGNTHLLLCAPPALLVVRSARDTLKQTADIILPHRDRNCSLTA
jgi:hypothetical protein